jgi:cysteine desulfurase
MKTVYLDNNATTQVAPEVLEAMLPYFHDLYGNPSSMHSFGGQVAQKIREAREQVAALIGATPDEIVFTSCGTESDNAAIRSALHPAGDVSGETPYRHQPGGAPRRQIPLRQSRRPGLPDHGAARG